MKRDRKDIKITATTPYKITEYDTIFIVLNGYYEVWGNRILWSEGKQKYFLKGKIIELVIESNGGQHSTRSYPLIGSVSFVDHRDWLLYSTCKSDKVKQDIIMHIHYSRIDYIILDFNSLDWKK